MRLGSACDTKILCFIFKHTIYKNNLTCLDLSLHLTLHLIILDDFSSPAGYLTVSSVVWWTTVKISSSVPAHICLSTQHMQRQEAWLHSMRHSMLLDLFVSQVSSRLKTLSTNESQDVLYNLYLSSTLRVCHGHCVTCAML